jgi:hypothetical protein
MMPASMFRFEEQGKQETNMKQAESTESSLQRYEMIQI